MTVEMFATELNRFLASDEPEVLCIVGRWGVGKTYAWKHYFSEAQKNKSVKLRKYAYISLFGRNSLDDVRTSIVENTVDSDVVGQQPDLKSFDSIVSRFLSNAKDVTKIAGYIPQASGYAASANRALYLMVSQQIICIDDLERAGNGLDVRNIMGLVSSLKEEKKCKAVILLNEEALEGEKKTDFHAHLEKIADTVIRFDPTAKEAAAIGVTKDQKYTDDLTKAVQDLAIVNIRVIKKIERFCRRAFELIGEHDPRLMQQTVQALALACYAKYQPGEAPSLGFIRNYNSMSDLIGVDPNKPRSDQKHRDILRNYGFSHMDEYDSIIFDAVERGYFSEDELKNQADELEQELKKRDKHDSFFGAWEDFHSSFEANQDAVLDRMYESVKSDYEVISPTDLSGTVGLFKELGRPEQAQEIIKIYIENRKDDPSFWDLSASGLGGHVTDQDVRSAFADKHAATRRQFDPEKFIRELPSRSGWNPEDVAEMAKVNEETLASIFKSLKRDEFKNAVNGALYFKNVSNKDSNMAKIVETAEKALRRIASESPINAMRVKSFGVTLDEPT